MRAFSVLNLCADCLSKPSCNFFVCFKGRPFAVDFAVSLLPLKEGPLNDCIECSLPLVGLPAPLDSYQSFQPRKKMNHDTQKWVRRSNLF